MRKHVTAHDPSAEVLEAARGEVVIDVLPPGRVTVHRLERLRADDPLMQPFAAYSHRVLEALVGTRAVPVDRD
jgi:hypothetical protein